MYHGVAWAVASFSLSSGRESPSDWRVAGLWCGRELGVSPHGGLQDRASSSEALLCFPVTNTSTCLTEVFPWLTHQFRCPAHFSVSVHFPVSPAPKLKPMACKANVRTCFQQSGLKPQQCGYLSVFNRAGKRLGSPAGRCWWLTLITESGTDILHQKMLKASCSQWATAGVHSTDLKMACLHPNPAPNHAMPFTRILKVR